MNNIEINPVLQEHLNQKEIKKIASDLCVMVYSDRTFSDGRFDEMLNYIKRKHNDIYQKLIEECDEKRFPRISRDKTLVGELNDDSFSDVLFALENNFCLERIEDIKIIGKKLYKKKTLKKEVNPKDKEKTRSSGATKSMQEEGGQRRGKLMRPATKRKIRWVWPR